MHYTILYLTLNKVQISNKNCFFFPVIMTYFDGKNVKIVSNNCMRNLLSPGKIAPEKDQSISSISTYFTPTVCPTMSNAFVAS